MKSAFSPTRSFALLEIPIKKDLDKTVCWFIGPDEFLYVLSREETGGFSLKRFYLKEALKRAEKRRCAHCARVAMDEEKFQVCRDCKSAGLSAKWWDQPCHFCSHACFKQGWSEHKKIHPVPQ